MIYNVLSALFKSFINVFYTLEIKGLENQPTKASIIAPNHASFLDPPLVNISHPIPLHFFARKTLFKNRFLSYFLKKLYAHPVGPGSEGMRALAQAKKLLENNEIVVMFPEGTRSEDGTLLPLRRGVVSLSLKSKAPIVPLCIQGAYEIWPRGSKFPKIGGKITLTYGKPLNPNNYSHLPSKEAATQMLEDLQNSLLSMTKNTQ